MAELKVELLVLVESNMVAVENKKNIYHKLAC